MEKGKWRKAEKCWKRLLVLVPEADGAHNALGCCYILNRKWGKAIKLFQALVQRSDQVAAYWMNYGYACAGKAGEKGTPPAEKKEVKEESRRGYQTAIQVDPLNPEPYMRLALMFLNEGWLDDALEQAENAVAADGVENFQDFEILYFICMVHVEDNRLDQVQATVHRLETILPDDPEARRFVVTRFLGDAGRFADARDFEMAAHFSQFALSLDPSNQELADLNNRFQGMSKALQELPRLEKDPKVMGPFKVFAVVDLMNLLQERSPHRRKALKWAQAQLDSYPPHRLRKSLNYLKKTYPGLFQLGEGRYQELRGKVNKNPKTKTPLPGPAPPGCVLILIMILVGLSVLSCLMAFFVPSI